MSRPFSWNALAEAVRRQEVTGLIFDQQPQDVAAAVGGKGFVYLATPYSKRVTDRLGRWNLPQSAALAAEAAVQVGRLKEVGVSAFSPIALSADIVHATLQMRVQATPSAAHDPLDAEAWLRWCMPFLQAASAVVVPYLVGWDQSEGIKAEVVEALKRGIPVFVYAAGVHHGV